MADELSVTQSAVPADHPLMVAWEAYKSTRRYADALKWATHVAESEHAEGSMWAAFEAGFRAGVDGELGPEPELRARQALERLRSRDFISRITYSERRWVSLSLAEEIVSELRIAFEALK